MSTRALPGLLFVASLAAGCAWESASPEERRARADRRIDEQLAPAGQLPPQREGIAAAILVDVSGSMDDRVEDQDGRKERKIEIARRAARGLVDQFAKYAEAHPGEPVLLGLYEFSARSGADCRPVIAMGPPDRARADAALAKMRANGGTPIGNAMVIGKRELDATGLSRRHLLVVTDGENTTGPDPDRVAQRIGQRPETERPSLYFVAFDIGAERFAKVREAGALVLGAANARELTSTLDSLLTGNILIER
jgi:Mg-chelatase subunit ChlD